MPTPIRLIFAGIECPCVSNKISRQLLNHAEPGVTNNYSRHCRSEKVREILETWAAHVEVSVGLNDTQGIVRMEALQ